MAKKTGVATRSGSTGLTRPSRMDSIDRQLLALLQADARATNAELARKLGLSPPGLQKRLKKLEQHGVIRQYVALLDREALGLDLLCLVNVSLAHHRSDLRERFREAMRRMPEVLECYFLTGEVDYVVKVVVANHTALEKFLFERLMLIEGVDRVRTSIVVNEIKASTALPLMAGGTRSWPRKTDPEQTVLKSGDPAP